MGVGSTTGTLLAIASAFFNGSFSVLFKTKRMVDLSIHPIIFQLYVSWGVFLSSLFVLPFAAYDDKELSFLQNFSLGGISAGALLVVAISASFKAIDHIGVALAQGIWGGVAMVVSYTWGTLVFGEAPTNTLLSLFGLFLLVVGVYIIAQCERIIQLIMRRQVPTLDEAEHLLTTNEAVGIAGTRTQIPNYLRGIFWACVVGIFGGSILVPMHLIPEEKQRLVLFLPSFGLGAFFTSPLILLFHYSCEKDKPAFHWKDASLNGLLSGLIYNIGNGMSIIATSSIGYAVAYPILQCAILISGLWGIFLFSEITDRYAIFVFFIGGVILVIGGVVLCIA